MMAPVSIELEVLFADLRLCLAQRRVQRALEEMVRKYRPDQPRAPKGTPEGGQWVVDPGSARQQELADEEVRVAGDETAGLPLDLRSEDARGGHAYSRHVGKSPEWLVEKLGATYRELGRVNGILVVEMRGAWGSFRALEDANYFVREVLSRNSMVVHSVVTGESEQATVSVRFGYVTGIEAYWPSLSPPPQIRSTYAVKVIIRHDPYSPRGYRVHTAFPFNEDTQKLRIE